MALNKVNGLIVPLLTPFNEDLSIDYFGLKTLTARLMNKGVDNFFVMGPLGEYEFISGHEWRKIIVNVISEVGPKGNVFVGCFGDSADEIIEKVKFAEKYTPYCVVNIPFGSLTNEIGFIDFFDKLFTKTKANIILYNDPDLFKRNILISGIDKIAGWEKFVAIFDNSKNMSYFKALSMYNQLIKIFQVNESLAVESFNHNSSGNVAGLANIVPEKFIDLKNNYDLFGYNSLIRQELSLISLVDALPKNKNIQSFKKILSLFGIIQQFNSDKLEVLTDNEILLIENIVKKVFA
ncbi:MAG: dihydrodipicolinate synthase family protein [archaeon]|jgi:4-hydroxy-tetrahydrodipicolinate synthase